MNMYLCPKCGNPYEDSAKYCPCCGNATGHILTSNPEDTTFLYCVPDTADGSEPNSAVPDTADGSEPNSAVRGFDPEPVTASDSALSQPIWVTRSMNQPLTGSLDESFLEDPSINTPTGEDSYSQKDHDTYISRVSSSSGTGVDVDIFDEVFETTSLIYSNMPSKIKKFIIISIVTTLLSIIPVIYVACSQQKDPGVSKDIQTSLTDDWVSSWNAAEGT